MLTREVTDLAHQLLARRAQIEGMEAPVIGVAAAFDIATVLEVVDIGDNPAGQQAQLTTERLLASAGI